MLTWETSICGNYPFTSRVYVLLSEADLRIKMKSLLVKTKGMEVAGCFSVRLREYHSNFIPCGTVSLRKIVGFWRRSVQGWLWTSQLQPDAEVNSWEIKDWVICCPWLTVTDGIGAQQVCAWQVSPQLLAAADNKHCSHPTWGLATTACSWVGTSGAVLLVTVGVEQARALEGPHGALVSPTGSFCSWGVQQTNRSRKLIWNSSGKIPRSFPLQECFGTECKCVKEQYRLPRFLLHFLLLLLNLLWV